jgi:hypothetical protein
VHWQPCVTFFSAHDGKLLVSPRTDVGCQLTGGGGWGEGEREWDEDDGEEGEDEVGGHVAALVIVVLAHVGGRWAARAAERSMRGWWTKDEMQSWPMSWLSTALVTVSQVRPRDGCAGANQARDQWISCSSSDVFPLSRDSSAFGFQHNRSYINTYLEIHTRFDAMRVRLSASLGAEAIKAWFNVDTSTLLTILDLKTKLCSSLDALRDLCLASTDVQLLVDGFELLDDSTVDVLREGDLIQCVVLMPST